jgi:hypothetical protein
MASFSNKYWNFQGVILHSWMDNFKIHVSKTAYLYLLVVSQTQMFIINKIWIPENCRMEVYFFLTRIQIWVKAPHVRFFLYFHVEGLCAKPLY